jgi:type IV pilus assembly protein PilN
MRISINLATKPFVELRPLFARLKLVMAVLCFVAIGLIIWLNVLSARAAKATAQMDALKARTNRVVQQRLSNEARMKQPQNKAVLDRSTFLNELFALKSFSWTATMMDLEKVLPNGVQVTSIEPVISKEGDVNIRLRVSGDRDRAIQLVRNLETSQRFVGPRLAGESSLTADKAKALGGVQTVSLNTSGQPIAGGVEFEIFSGYNPVQAVKANVGKAREEAMVKSFVRHDRKKKPTADMPMLPGAAVAPVTGKPAPTGRPQ